MRQAARLRRTTDVQRVRRTGTARADRHYAVSAIASPAGTSRIAVSVPAQLGGSVVRNRARRRARGAFAPLLGRLRGSTDLLVTVRPAAVEADFQDLVRSAEALLAEHGLLEPGP